MTEVTEVPAAAEYSRPLNHKIATHSFRPLRKRPILIINGYDEVRWHTTFATRFRNRTYTSQIFINDDRFVSVKSAFGQLLCCLTVLLASLSCTNGNINRHSLVFNPLTADPVKALHFALQDWAPERPNVKNLKWWVRPVWRWTLRTAAVWNSWRWKG